ALGDALENSNAEQTLEVEFGNIIDYKERGDIQEQYKAMFDI
ncbi:MAG: Unknown protein, partial [uncultured Sulfurovum sp.]